MRFQGSFDDDRKLPPQQWHVAAAEKRDSDSAGRTAMMDSCSFGILQDPMDEGDGNATRQAIVSRYTLSAPAAVETASANLNHDGENDSATDNDEIAFPLLIPSLPDDADTTMISSAEAMEARSSSLRPRTIARPKAEEWLLSTSESRPVVDFKMIYESPASIQRKILDVAVSSAVGTPVVPVADSGSDMFTGRRFFDFRTPTKHSLRPRPRKESCSPSNHLGFNRALLNHQGQQRRHQHHHHQQQDPMIPFLASPKIMPQPLHLATDQQQHQGPMLPYFASPKIMPQTMQVMEQHQPPPPPPPPLSQQHTSRRHHNYHPRDDSQHCGSSGHRPKVPKPSLPQFPNF